MNEARFADAYLNLGIVLKEEGEVEEARKLSEAISEADFADAYESYCLKEEERLRKRSRVIGKRLT